jgi:hypothetical protein
VSHENQSGEAMANTRTRQIAPRVIAYLCGLAGLAQAATTPSNVGYTCQAPDGSVIYSQRACGDQPQPIQARDQRTPSQWRQGMEMKEREATLSRDMGRSREQLQQEGNKRPAMPLTVAMRRPSSSATGHPQTSKTETLRHQRTFMAVVPKAAKAKKAKKAK